MEVKFAIVTAAALLSASGALAEDGSRPDGRGFSDGALRGTWVITGWTEATLLAPIPAELTATTPPSAVVSPGDKITVRGTLVGLVDFDGHGAIPAFRNLFKAGGLEPMSPPFPLSFLPPAPEEGRGQYSVSPEGTVHISTTVVDPDSGLTVGETDYDCVLSLVPRRLDCIFSRFRTYVVDPGGFEAPIVGQVTLRPQRR